MPLPITVLAFAVVARCGVTVGYGPPQQGMVSSRIDPSPGPIAPPPDPSSRETSGESKPIERIKVHGKVMESKLITKLMPAYPAATCEARRSGRVHLRLMIGKDGLIRD